jgi:hypothetical protein
MDIGADEIRKWHVDQNGWDDIGYHSVVRRNGVLEQGRNIAIPGAHVRGHNSDSIGIALVGGVDELGNPDCNYTRDQWSMLEADVAMFQRHSGPVEVFGHRDFTSEKECPCFDARAWWTGGVE